MKVNIVLNPINNKIIGYNTIIDDIEVDSPWNKIIDADLDDELFSNIGNCYFVDGKISMKAESDNSEIDELEKSMNEKEMECSMYHNLVQNEHEIFMDGIISGTADMETLSKNAKTNRESYYKAKNDLEELRTKYEMKMQEATNSAYIKEEKEINYKYYVSAVLLIRDENQYLEEWLDEAFKVGIDHVYIYDNMSEKPVQEFLEEKQNPYLDKITFILWESTESTQQDAYNDFLSKYGNETRWCIAYDADEFINISKDGVNLKEYLKANEEYGYVLCQWCHYNADGHIEKPEGSVIANYTTRADWYDRPSTGKEFVQTNRCAKYSRHTPVLKIGCFPLNSQENTETIQLNHYITKSLDEWTEKINRGSCDPIARRNYRLFFQLNPDMSSLDTGEEYIQPYEQRKKDDV